MDDESLPDASLAMTDQPIDPNDVAATAMSETTVASPLSVTIFFAWQSDLPDSTNRSLIRAAQREAASRMELSGKLGARLRLDEATRNEPGSPDIPATIFRKIANADIFLCDVTTINSASQEQSRPTPNPNVLVELGYAAATLGWSRCVMLFNDAHGKLADLPFDIDRRRVVAYTANLARTQDKGWISVRNTLSTTLCQIVEEVMQQNPPRPIRTSGLVDEATRRVRDIRTLKKILDRVSLDGIDVYLKEGPQHVNSYMLDFQARLDAIWTSTLTGFYDRELSRLFGDLHRLLNICLPPHFDRMYGELCEDVYQLKRLTDHPTVREKDDREALMTAFGDLWPVVKQLVDHIRHEYPDIDIEEECEQFWKTFVSAEPFRVLQRKFASSPEQETERKAP